MVKNLPAVQEIWVQSLGWEDSWRRAWQPTPVFLPGESHGQRSLVGYSPRGHKELDMAEVTERATHTRLSHMTNHVSGVSGLGCFEEGEGSAEGSWGQVGM